jgi:hypothetical protein
MPPSQDHIRRLTPRTRSGVKQKVVSAVATPLRAPFQSVTFLTQGRQRAAAYCECPTEGLGMKKLTWGLVTVAAVALPLTLFRKA